MTVKKIYNNSSFILQMINLSHRLWLKMDDTSPPPPDVENEAKLSWMRPSCVSDVVWQESLCRSDRGGEAWHQGSADTHARPITRQSGLSIMTFITSNNKIKLIRNMNNHLLTWRRQGSWPRLQLATRGRSQRFGFTSGEVSCRPSLFTVDDFNTWNHTRWSCE